MKRLFQKTIGVVAFFLFFVISAIAHVDTGIELKGKSLVGLPEQYQPAEFDVERLTLRIGKQSVTFGDFIQALFRDSKPYDLWIFASWYHSPSILPPYLLIRIQPKDRDFRYDLLVDLDTLKLIKASVVLRISEDVIRRIPIDLSALPEGSIEQPKDKVE